MSALCERDPDITIIIPVYNLEQFITPMLDSLKRQDFGDYKAEIIFVDNNCTDGTVDVIRKSGLDCQIIPCATQGCGPARNAALDIARGTYIWMMDGDDWLLTDTAVRDVLDTIDGDILRIPFDSDLYLCDYYSMVWQYVLRREFVEEFRFPDYQPAEDDAYMAAVLMKAGYFGRHLALPKIDEALYYYNYMRDGSNMNRVSRGERI